MLINPSSLLYHLLVPCSCMVVVGDGLLSTRGAFLKNRSSVKIHSMKQVCETSVVTAFRCGPFWNSKIPKNILGFNPMELDFGGCQQLVRLGLLLYFPKKKQTHDLCVPFHWVLFSVANQSINQSINFKVHF